MTNRTPLAACLLLVLPLALSGCTDAPAEATLVVDFGGQGHDPDAWSVTVGFDPDHRPSLPAYQDAGKEPTDAYTAHDLLVQWAEEEGVEVATTYYDGLGFSLDAIDGISGAFSDTECWYWSLSVDGTPSEVGMDSVVVEDGTEVAWTYTDCS